mmetsp:Transcript_118315/g.185825  ORF Transcript_118315/g.185825 Transcript_118315/m.185825 type:complete len:205 (-) Transcript_118315:72-686(-)
MLCSVSFGINSDSPIHVLQFCMLMEDTRVMQHNFWLLIFLITFFVFGIRWLVIVIPLECSHSKKLAFVQAIPDSACELRVCVEVHQHGRITGRRADYAPAHGSPPLILLSLDGLIVNSFRLCESLLEALRHFIQCRLSICHLLLFFLHFFHDLHIWHFSILHLLHEFFKLSVFISKFSQQLLLRVLVYNGSVLNLFRPICIPKC